MGSTPALPQPGDDFSIERGFEHDDPAIRAAALEAAVQRYGDPVAASIYRYLGGKVNEHDLRDIVSQMFSKIWRKLQKGPWRIRTSLFGLLYKTATWVAQDHLRIRSTWTKHHTPIDGSNVAETVAEHEQHPWEEIQRRESLKRFADYVSRLPGLQREVGLILARHFVAADTLPSKREIVAELARAGRVTTEASLKSCLKEITRKFSQQAS